MNGFDLVTTVVALVGLLVGLAIGAARMALGLVAVVTGLLVAMALGPRLGAVLTPILESESAAAISGFVLVYAGALVAFALVAWLVRSSLRQLGLGWFDRAAGALIAGAGGLAALALATAAAAHELEGRAFTADSLSFALVRSGGDALFRMVAVERSLRPDGGDPPAEPSAEDGQREAAEEESTASGDAAGSVDG